MSRRCVAVLPDRGSFLVLSALLLAALCATTASAASVDVELVSDDRGVLPLYEIGPYGRGDTHRAYVEAAQGDRYGIRIRNNTGRRVAVVVAVDGRNVISGEKSYLRNTERMYILGPYESQKYDGWRTARDTIHRFYFTDPGDSYAGAFGDHSAMGVVAVAVYREKADRPPRSAVGREKEERAAGLAPESGKAAGTGFGEERYSPSVRVRFRPESRTAERHFLKYEWRDTLCRNGIVDCRLSGNRFWDDEQGYAPHPPGRRSAR